MSDEKNQNQPDENILAAYEKIRRLGNIQSTISPLRITFTPPHGYGLGLQFYFLSLPLL